MEFPAMEEARGRNVAAERDGSVVQYAVYRAVPEGIGVPSVYDTTGSQLRRKTLAGDVATGPVITTFRTAASGPADGTFQAYAEASVDLSPVFNTASPVK